jgi:hypothetical protein
MLAVALRGAGRDDDAARDGRAHEHDERCAPPPPPAGVSDGPPPSGRRRRGAGKVRRW